MIARRALSRQQHQVTESAVDLEHKSIKVQLSGVGLLQLTRAASARPVAGFVIVDFAIHEGREAGAGELVAAD